MEGIVFDIKRFAIHDGPGIRTTVFLKGCSLDCRWCHNPESISPKIEEYISEERIGEKIFKTKKLIGKKTTAEEVFNEIYKEKIFMEEGKGGVTLSGGEPLLQPDFVLSIFTLCKQAGIHTTIDTAANVPQSNFEKIISVTDLFLFDIKFISSDKHKEHTGADNKLILNNFKYLIQNGKQVIVRIPVIPDANMNKQELLKILNFLLPFKGDNFSEVHLLPYHHIGQSKYLRFNKNDRMKGTAEPDKSELLPFKKLFENSGFKVTVK